jgi:hypothetical protein
MRRVPHLCVAAAAVLAFPASSATAENRALETPDAREIAASSSSLRDTVLPNRSRRLQAALATGSWGGRYPTGSGDDVTINVSDRYLQDPATIKRWADFFGGLLHGRELGELTVFLAPPDQVESICGPSAAACYSPEQSLLIAPGEDLPNGTPAEAVITHEYGHHVAAYRLNPPWDAVEWGTKRWASYVGVCAKTRAGTLFPGAETIPNYRFNPGEAFAETYRVLNERRAGLAEIPWGVVDESLYPDQEALSLVQQDVLDPWQSNAVQRFRGRGSHSYTVTAALDGRLNATLKASSKARFSLAVSRADGTRVSRTQTRPGKTTATATTTVCGERSFTIRVSRTRGTGPYLLTVSHP